MGGGGGCVCGGGGEVIKVGGGGQQEQGRKDARQTPSNFSCSWISLQGNLINSECVGLGWQLERGGGSGLKGGGSR